MRVFKIPFKAMACDCEVVIASDDEALVKALAQAAIAEVQRIEFKYSRYRQDSMVSLINSAAGLSFVDCDAETWALLEYADSLYHGSEFLFDITAGVLRRAWNFKVPKLPAEDELARLRSLIDWSCVERDNQPDNKRVRLPKIGMEIDFGGFGKEYAADRAGAILARNGILHGYVNLGGDMRVLGPKPDGLAWMIGIQDPRKQNKILATIPVSQGGLATSGDYERFFELNGRRYCHVLDPRSGYPVTFWRSISVIAPLTVIAGNCTTIAMLKQQAGLAYLDDTGMSYLAVDQHGTLHMNKT